MPKDAQKSKKQPPAFIKTAQEVLAREDVKAHIDYDLLKRALPAVAAKLHQAEQEVTVDSLAAEALKGATSLRTLSASLNTKQTLSYRDIVPPYKAPEPAYTNSTANNHLMRSAKHGNMDEVKSALKRGADITAMGNYAILEAAENGHLEVVKYLHQNGADIIARHNYALLRALEYGHLEVVKYLHQNGADIIGDDNYVIRGAAQNGHLAVVKYLHQNGADITADDNYAIRRAAENGHFEIVKYLHQNGADITAMGNCAIRGAADYGCLEVVKYLHQNGADITGDDNYAIRRAAYNGHLNVVQYLHAQGTPLSVLLNHHQQEYKQFLQWQKIARVSPPKGCLNCNPRYFIDKNVQNCFEVVSDILINREGYRNQRKHANKIAFQAAVLFRDDQAVMRYLKTHGNVKDKTPLHDLIQMIKLPETPPAKADLIAWRDAIIQHGPKMADLTKFMDKLPRPMRSASGDNWLYYETRAECAKHAYNKASKNPELASVMMEHLMDEDDFEEARKLTKKYKKQYGATDAPKTNGVPDVDFTLKNGMTYKKLPDGDYRGLVLGQITDCCQSIGGAGAKCTKHGYLSDNGGFYVVTDKKGKIIGQSWAWIGAKDELVLDSLETLSGRIDKQTWADLTIAFAKTLQKDAPKITALHIGTGGRTPSLDFKHKNATPKDYKGYRDSRTQYRVWKR